MGVEYELLAIDPMRLSDFRSRLEKSPVCHEADFEAFAKSVGLSGSVEWNGSLHDAILLLGIEYAASKKWYLGKIVGRGRLASIFKDVRQLRSVPLASLAGSDVDLDKCLGIQPDVVVVAWTPEAVDVWATHVDRFDRIESVRSLLDEPCTLLDRFTGGRKRLKEAVQVWTSDLNFGTWADIVEAIRFVRANRFYLGLMITA